jgi:membrane associated rhomboid family serine protease
MGIESFNSISISGSLDLPEEQDDKWKKLKKNITGINKRFLFDFSKFAKTFKKLSTMQLSAVLIIIISTVAVSFIAFKDKALNEKMMFSPYKVQHDKEYMRLITHIFIHGDVFHLMFNMFSLYFLGTFLENELTNNMYFEPNQGMLHFLIIYFFGGLFSTLIPFIRNKNNPEYLSLGASGGVSAVIFAAIIWAPTLPLSIMFFPIPIPAYIFGPIYLAFEFWADRKGNTGIAHDAHIGGAVFGVLYVLIINIDKGKQLVDLIF